MQVLSRTICKKPSFDYPATRDVFFPQSAYFLAATRAKVGRLRKEQPIYGKE
jgi:hypothetical protein